MLNWSNPIPDNIIKVASPLMRGLVVVVDLAGRENGIGLTQTGRIKRKYVDPLVREMDWPHYDIEDYYAVSKVMNEDDFFPLVLVHDLMRHLKLGRHYKGQFKLTKKYAQTGGQLSALYPLVMPRYLFEINHMASSRFQTKPIGNWNVWLGVTAEVAKDPVTVISLYEAFYGSAHDRDEQSNNRNSSVFRRYDDLYRFYQGVVQPLLWSGLLNEQRPANDTIQTRLLSKSPIWTTLES